METSASFEVRSAPSPHPTSEVVFARPGDLSLLGARTLEDFNATVDARRKRLVTGGPLPAMCAM